MTALAGLEVGAQGFGGMALAEVYGPTDADAALATLHHAVDAGIRLIDTADVYGRGSNERLVGRLLRERRDEVVLATKFGFVRDPAPGGPRFRGDPAYVREAATASLGRLGVDRIDLYYYHRVDSRVPIEETVGALAELVREGIAQLALAWLAERGRAHGIPVVPIPSTRRPERVDENLAAVDVRLSAATLAALEPLAGLVEGDRARHVDDISQGRERRTAVAG